MSEKKREKVVYILGAGFSAPLGLPLMSNFYEKSKDMYIREPEKYMQFKSVFDTINEMSVSKNYYSTNLFNIEEILSILEMQGHLGDKVDEQEYIQYIIEVINYYTPDYLNSIGQHPSPQDDLIGRLFRGLQNLQFYGFFVCSILNLKFIDYKKNAMPEIVINPKRVREYSIVTVNYDVVIETIADLVEQNFNKVFPQGLFNRRLKNHGTDKCMSHIAKLHGSVDAKRVITPTWNKTIKNQGEITQAWRLAYKLITEANHIRILGYSLPSSDSYIKYLLRTAVLKSEHLKSIDVICLDDGTVKERYDEFILFHNYKFISGRIEDYMLRNYAANPLKQNEKGHDELGFSEIEEAHKNFMNFGR